MSEAAAFLGIASSLYSGYQQADAQQKQADSVRAQGAYEQNIDQRNAAYALQSAQDAIKNGDLEAERNATGARGTIGAQRVSYGAQGVDANSGSALAVQTDTAQQSAIDQGTIRMNAWKEAYGLKVQAQNDLTQADFASKRANGEYDALQGEATTSLVKGGLQATSDYLNYYGQTQDTRRPTAPRG